MKTTLNYAVSAFCNGTLIESGSLSSYGRARKLADLWKSNHGQNIDRIKIHTFSSWEEFRELANQL